MGSNKCSEEVVLQLVSIRVTAYKLPLIHVLWFGPYLEEQAFSIEDENRFWSNTFRFLQLCNVTECPNVLTCNNVLYMKLVCESLEGNELTGWSCHTQC